MVDVSVHTDSKPQTEKTSCSFVSHCGIIQESKDCKEEVLDMCCRYYIRESDPALTPVIDAALKSPLMARFAKAHPAPLIRSGEVRPTDLAAVVASDRQSLHLPNDMGLHSSWKNSSYRKCQGGNSSRKAELQRCMEGASVHRSSILVL